MPPFRFTPFSRVKENCAAIVEFVTPAQIAPTSIDPDDDAVLACALPAGADLIVSGDPDLPNLKQFHCMPIVSRREAVARSAA